MKTIDHYSARASLKGYLLLICSIVMIYSCASGQSKQRITCSGIEVSSGVHGIVAGNGLMKLRAQTTGASIGFVSGNNLMKARIRPIGFYKAGAMEQRKFDLLESEVIVNIYPLEFIRTRKHILDIYIATGASMQKFTYSRNNAFVQQDGPPDLLDFHSIRKVTVFSQTAGIGFEFYPKSGIQLFTEAIFSNRIHASSDNEHVRKTLQAAVSSVNTGIRFIPGKRQNVSRTYLRSW